MTCYFDADHAHDVISRCGVPGIFIFINNNPVQWYSKLKNTVESSTYRSESDAARIATELVLTLRYKLCMLGKEDNGPTIIFGDTNLVIQSGSLPSSKLKKKHNSIA